MAASNSGSPFTQASQTAKQFGAEFNEVAAGTVALTTIQTVAEFAHGLSTTPDFVMTGFVGAGGISSWVTAAVDATTVTVSTGNTTNSKTISIFAGDLA